VDSSLSSDLLATLRPTPFHWGGSARLTELATEHPVLVAGERRDPYNQHQPRHGALGCLLLPCAVNQLHRFPQVGRALLRSDLLTIGDLLVKLDDGRRIPVTWEYGRLEEHGINL